MCGVVGGAGTIVGRGRVRFPLLSRPGEYAARVATLLQVLGGLVLSAGMALLAPWAGLVALGVLLIVFGVAAELPAPPRAPLAAVRGQDAA